jgi:hypothetical protein
MKSVMVARTQAERSGGAGILDNARFDALVHYVCARCDNPGKLGATKLNKVLWYSDVFAFAQEGRSISGAVYVKRQFGPVPKDILNSIARLEAAGCLVERKVMNHGYPQKQFIALKPADISALTSTQISLVDTVLEAICSGHTATSISNLSHDLVWEAAEIGEEIPMSAAAFAGNFGEIDEEDIAWARNEVDRIEGTRVSA